MKKKKGFTLVELLVVIAILAILAAVSVVGYLGFTEKANLSNDQTTIKMLNDNLMAEFVEEKPKSAGEAMTRLENLGITKEKLTAYSNNYHYAYNLDDNRFVLLDENDNAVYPDGATKDGLWGLYMGNENDLVSVSNYVTFNPILKAEELDYLLDEGNITIDLNNMYLNAKGYTTDNTNKVILTNGFYVADNNSKVIDIANSSDIEKMNDYVTSSTVSTLLNKPEDNGVIIIDNVILDFTLQGGGMQIKQNITTRFSDCVFLTYNQNDEKQAQVITITDAWPPVDLDPFPKDGSKLEIYNSTFIGASALCTDVLNVVVDNCVFTSGNGGIDLQAPTLNAQITNNTFDFSLSTNNPNSNFVISISNRTYGELPEDYDIRKYNIDFTRNTVIESNCIIKFHPNCYSGEDNKLYQAVEPDNISISNNNIKNIGSNYVQASYDKDTGEANQIPEDLQTIIDKLIAKFK